MRKLVIAATISLIVGGAAGEKPRHSTTSQLPDGIVSGNNYTNEALGVIWDFPDGWKVITEDNLAGNLDPGHPNSRAVQCSKVLVWIKAPQQSEDRFASFATLIAIDPTCLSNAEFPKQFPDAKRDVDAVVDAVIKNFKRSPFFSPYGVKVIAFPSPAPEQRVTIDLTGGMTINAIAGHPAPRKEPLNVNTHFSVTEWHGYWMAIASVADDPSDEELKKAKPAFIDVTK